MYDTNVNVINRLDYNLQPARVPENVQRRMSIPSPVQKYQPNYILMPMFSETIARRKLTGAIDTEPGSPCRSRGGTQPGVKVVLTRAYNEEVAKPMMGRAAGLRVHSKTV
jgi:hypothetical protein